MSQTSHRIETPWGLWEPFTPERMGRVLERLEVPWWIGGGWALERFAGHGWRMHDDVDVGLFRPDQAAMRAFLDEWDVHRADPPGSLRPWGLGEELPAHVHDIWVRESPAKPWRFQLMIDEREGDDWLYRRDARVRRPIATLSRQHGTYRYLAPEIQLLYKAKGLRPKDRADFDHTLPHLTASQRAWLREALALSHPEHPWLGSLRA